MPNWTDIYIKTSPVIRGACRRYVKDFQLVEDITQETFITAIEKVESYSGKGSIEGWIRRIAINKCLEYIRKNKANFEEIKDDKFAEELNQEIMSSNPKQKIINTDFSNEELISVIDRLPDHHKQVFNMYVIDKISHQEISKTLDISVGTSKSHLSRARKKTQEYLFAIANQKQEEKRKRKGIFFLLPLGLFTDQLFANQLYNYSIPSGTIVPDFITKADSKLITPPAQTGVAISSYIIIGLCAVSLASFFFYIYTKQDVSSNNIPTKQTNPIISQDSSSFIKTVITSKEDYTSDTITQSNPIIKNTNDNSTNNNKVPDKTTVSKPNEKELIRKKVIIKQPVIIKDTVYQLN